jgi:hypothetical protein
MEMTTMPAAQARGLDLPLPQQAVSPLTMRGQEVRAGYLRVQVPGLDGMEYVFPCYFLGDPNVPTGPAVGGLPPRYLLGPSGVIDKLCICIDGDPGPGAPYGYLTVEKK